MLSVTLHATNDGVQIRRTPQQHRVADVDALLMNLEKDVLLKDNMKCGR